MIRKMLVAGRGVLACRVMRTCQALGIATVAVYTDVDKDALHVAVADEAIYLGADVASYHNQQAVLDVMQRSGADALHPLNGPFASAPGFAYFIKGAGMTFVGPSPECIEVMYDEQMSRQFLHDVPQTSDAMVQPTRRIEVQIAADAYNMVVALGDRELTLQADGRATLIEAPVSNIHQDARAACFEMALRVAEQLGYTNIGTVHLVLDAHDRVYFDKMATHLTEGFAVTEAAADLDLVQVQIELAQGVSLLDVLPSHVAFDHSDQDTGGHAVQALVQTTSPENETTDQILHLRLPRNIVLDVGIRQYQMLSKASDQWLVSATAFAHKRSAALRLLDYALSQLIVLGVQTNIATLQQILRHPMYRPGTNAEALLSEERPPSLFSSDTDTLALIALAIVKASSMVQNNAQRSLRLRFSSQQGQTHEIVLTLPNTGRYRVVLVDMIHDVELIERNETSLILTINGHRQAATVVSDTQHRCWIHTQTGVFQFNWHPPSTPPMPDAPQAG